MRRRWPDPESTALRLAGPTGVCMFPGDDEEPWGDEDEDEEEDEDDEDEDDEDEDDEEPEWLVVTALGG